ncbi:uncharacterized protein LOC131164963 [Malania oleifera]|uniref:uncharacterized protein LOC131164963 n=1 Tax=Malania oleifera TaxID=397392 RepID=UPI0025AE394D|nr:uncharacterized protein LOC131164963 [Malania oleifera]
MATSSHRSPSPHVGRPNPNSRTQENSSDARKSFSGNPATRPSSIVAHPRGFNPTTPANSPSDFGRKNPVYKESLASLRDYEQKENEKDSNLKPARLKPPAALKGTKNFMSPTISAASKFTPSPRKKILTERNEPVRTPVSFSDGKSPFSSTNLLNVADDSDPMAYPSLNQMKNEASSDSTATESLNQMKNEASSDSTVTESGHWEASISEGSKQQIILNSKIPLSSQNASESLTKTITIESNSVDASPMSVLPCSPSTPSLAVLAPLDADPSLPPYDPKTNYLSPRPRFLHYRPNPRIEAYLNKEREVGMGEGGQLGDHLTSFECFSDTENSEETESDDSQKEYEDVVSPVEATKEEEEEEEDDDVHLPKDVSEPRSMATPKSEDVSELKSIPTNPSPVKRIIEAKCTPKPKPYFLVGSKSIGLLLILVIACLSVSNTDSPVISYSTYRAQTSEVYRSSVAKFAEANFVGLAQTFQVWLAQNVRFLSAYSVSYVSKFILILSHADKLGPLHYGNLTALHKDFSVDDFIVVDNSHNRGMDDEGEQSELRAIEEVEVGIGPHNKLGPVKKVVGVGMGGQNELRPVRENKFEMGLMEEQDHQVIDDVNTEEASAHGNLEKHCTLGFDEVHSILHDEVSKPDYPEAEQTEEDNAIMWFVDFHMDKELQNNIDFVNEPVLASEALKISSEMSEAAEVQGGSDLNPGAKIEPIKEEAGAEIAKSDDVSFGGSQSSEMFEAAEIQGENDLISGAKTESIAKDADYEISKLDYVSFGGSQSSEMFEAAKVQGENDLNSATKTKSIAEDYLSFGGSQSLVTVDATMDGSEDRHSNVQNMFGIFLVILTLAVASAMLHTKKAKKSTTNAPIPMDQQLAKKSISSSVSPEVEQTNQERRSSENWPTEVDIVAESCPSDEMSSFQKSSSHSIRDEAQSWHDRKPGRNYKRESLASSDYSLDSLSYGSFTTYEKIPYKHGEEETVTPVRRSSRIRKQVTSP